MLVHGASADGDWELSDQPTTRRGPLRAAEPRRAWPGFQAPDRDFQAGDAFVAGHRGHAAGAHGIENAISSARSGSSWPTGRWRIE